MSGTKTPVRVVNRLIASMPRQDRSRILQRSEPVDLVFGAVLCEPDEPFRHVYFPLTGFISLVAPVRGRQPLEIGLVGNEGMIGATLALGVTAIPMRAVVQGSGTALRMTTARFRRLLRDNSGVLKNLNRYLYVLMAQVSQTATCSRFHDVEARLARWLLQSHDRAHANHFHLTHKFLAGMLGVRRSGVTIAAGDLQRRDLISYRRGTIRVLDRKGLEAASCDCYGAVVEDYARMFP